MEDKRGLIYEAIREVIRDKILSFLRRYCRCVEIEERYRDILELADRLDKIEEAIRKRENLYEDKVRVKVNRGLLRTRICIEHEGKTYCNDEVDVFLSKVRSIIAYYRTDCDLDNLISDTLLTNDFKLIDFVRTNLEKLREVCRGVYSSLDMSMLEDYVQRAVRESIEEYLSIVKGRVSSCEESCS